MIDLVLNGPEGPTEIGTVNVAPGDEIVVTFSDDTLLIPKSVVRVLCDHPDMPLSWGRARDENGWLVAYIAPPRPSRHH